MADLSTLKRAGRWFASILLIVAAAALLAATGAGVGVFLFASGWVRAFGFTMFAGGAAALLALLYVYAVGMAAAPDPGQGRRGWRFVACGALTAVLSAVCLVHILWFSGA